MARRASRKRRRQRQRQAHGGGAAARGGDGQGRGGERSARASGLDALARGYARGREKDEAARAALRPLAPGERPRAVTVAAVVALLLGLANVVAYAAGLEVQGDRPAAAGVIAYSGLMLLAAWGMWRARYWAVLGMEAVLGLVVVVFALLALRSENLGELAIALGVIGAAGTLFWFLIKAMARIQMPERPKPR